MALGKDLVRHRFQYKSLEIKEVEARGVEPLS